MSDLRAIAARASSILESDEWKEAWNAYRSRIMEEMESAASDDDRKVMHLKRLLAAATAARKHLELMIQEGAVAAAQITFDEQKKKFSLFKR